MTESIDQTKKKVFPACFPSAESAAREATTERRRQRRGRAERKSVADAKHDGDAKPFNGDDGDDAKSVTELGRENVTKSDDEKHHEGGDQFGQKTGRIETGNRQK